MMNQDLCSSSLCKGQGDNIAVLVDHKNFASILLAGHDLAYGARIMAARQNNLSASNIMHPSTSAQV